MSAGTFSGARTTMTDVDCVTSREALSARIDGEAEPVPAELTDQHLASCGACRSWQARAIALSRALRVRQAPAVPDLSATILEMAAPPLSTRGWWARIALIAVAAAQIGLALTQVLGVAAPGNHGHTGLAGAEHLFNESTAWNLALGIGLLWAAFRARVTSGLIPVLGGFVALLGMYSVHDLIAGTAPVSRVVQHGLLLIALGLLIVINRWYQDPAPGHGEALEDVPHDYTAPADAGPGEPAPGRGSASRRGPLRPAGRHRAA
jgi:predicted anti-sigma-YlaC factor YlaD